MASQISSGSKKNWILGGGIAAAIALVGLVALDYPPAQDDAAGTIVPAKRFRADEAGGSVTAGTAAATQSSVDGNGAAANAGVANAASNAAFNAGQNAGQHQIRIGIGTCYPMLNAPGLR